MNKAHCTSPDSFAHASFQAGAPGASGGFFHRLVGLPLAALETLLVWQERVSERQRLRRMDDHMLKDMGISRADAEREAAVPFWRAG